MEGTSDCSLVAAFAGLSDPRQSAKVLYPLPEIMLLLLCATLAGADDFVEIAVWGEQNLGFLRRLLPFQHGIPSHDTLGEVIAMLDPAVFRDCFTGWVTGLRKPMPEAVGPEVIAIDGKTSRRSHARRNEPRPAVAQFIPPYSRSAALMLCRTTSGDRRGASGGATRLSGGLCVR